MYFSLSLALFSKVGIYLMFWALSFDLLTILSKL
jgi:hypothetical protein